MNPMTIKRNTLYELKFVIEIKLMITAMGFSPSFNKIIQMPVLFFNEVLYATEFLLIMVYLGFTLFCVYQVALTTAMDPNVKIPLVDFRDA